MSEIKKKYLAVETYDEIIDIDGEKYAVPKYAELAEMVYRLRNRVDMLESNAGNLRDILGALGEWVVSVERKGQGAKMTKFCKSELDLLRDVYQEQGRRDIVEVIDELIETRADAETSRNHNSGVIDRIIEQLREAGYTGTLPEMVDAVIEDADILRQYEEGE